jgi:solute carrier family 25 carnitine/acylcarnitine transporter 20/29
MSFDLEHFYKGAVSGATGLLCSHPVDTIKTNVQNGTKIKWGIRSLYKGVTPPLIGMGLEKAIVFGVYQNTYKKLQTDSSELLKRALAGATAGFACSFVVTPVDRLKILYQTNQTLDKMKIGMLYRGFSNTMTREMPGFAIYFNVYDYLKSSVVQPSFFHHFVFGAASGATAWAFIYPQDLIKTRIQASSDMKFGQAVKNIYKKNGFGGFFKGFHLAVLRAIPLHAGTLSMFEFLTRKE